MTLDSTLISEFLQSLSFVVKNSLEFGFQGQLAKPIETLTPPYHIKNSLADKQASDFPHASAIPYEDAYYFLLASSVGWTSLSWF